MAFNGLAFGLPFTMNSVEGTEAALFVAAAASRSTWRKAMIAVGAAVATLVPFGVVLWAAFHFVGAEYLDYTIAFLIFALGAREVREGLEERPRRAGPSDPGQVEHIGLAPASGESVRAFQRRHGVEETGVIDVRTRAAIKAARAEAGYAGVDPYAFGVDPVDVDQVRAFQSAHRLPPTGDVDALTRGALRVAQQQGLVDPRDPDRVRRFQREHDLRPTGDVDPTTNVALSTVQAEGSTTVGERDDGTPVRVDPVRAWQRFDPGDSESVVRLQRSLGLVADATIGDETRGALLALRARLGTRATVDGSEDGSADGRAAALTPDVADVDAVRAFQRRYGLDADGVVDDETRHAINYARDHDVDVDPTDEQSICAFQRRHGLVVDGVIGPRTQAALASARAERFAAGRKQRKQRYGELAARDGAGPVLDVDVADAGSIRAFQRRHRLADDGVVGGRTREALALSLRSRTDGGPRIGDHSASDQGRGGPLGRVRTAMGDAWPAYVGVMLETSEALLYSFAVASSSFAFMPAIVGAGIGFSWPWTVLPLVRRLTRRIPEWKQELGIGLILVSVAAAFGLLHMVGVFG